MEWLVIGIAVIVVIGWLGNSGSKRRANSDVSAGRSRSGREAYASLHENGEYIPLSADDVTLLFAPYRERLKAHKANARKLSQIADRYFDHQKLDEKALAALSSAEPAAKADLDAINALWDNLFFNTESGDARWLKVVEEFDAAHAEIEEHLASVVDTRRMIANGEFE